MIPRLPFRVAASLLAATLVAATLLSGCGNIGDLEPARGQPLPVKPLMAQSTPTPEELLTPPSYASPNRVDELMRRSTPRMSDRFDLPPPSGGAPKAPAAASDTGANPDEDSDEAKSKGPVQPI